MATITVTPAEFRKAARWAKPTAVLPIPILGNVRVSVTGSQLVVAWFDWETLLLARVRGQAAVPDQTATVLVPADQLQAALAAADGPGTKGPLEVTVHDGDKVDLVTAPGTAKAQRISVGQTADPDAYPAFPDMPPLTGMAMSDTFVPAVKQIAGCCSDEPLTPLIGAVHFIPGPETLELQGTNRYILAVDQVPFRPAPAGVTGAGFLVPARLAVKFARGCDGPVLIGAPTSPGGFVLLSDSWHTMVTKATVGDYPKVRAITARPPAPAAQFTCDAVKLWAVLDEARGQLDVAVQEMVDAALADETDTRFHVDKRRNIHQAHDGHGMFIAASQAGVEVFAVHQGTSAELGRWHVTSLDDPPEEEVTVCLNPAYLSLLLPGAGEVTVTLSAPFKNVRVTVPGTAYEGVACPIKLTPPVREEATV